MKKSGGFLPNLTGGRVSERIIQGLLTICGFLSIFVTVGIVVFLLTETVAFFQEVSLVEFFTETRWTPLFVPKHFGILPLFWGTFAVTLGASLLAIPVGLGSAIYLSEYAKEPVRKVIKPVLEVLAGIPTVVYGYFALTFVTPIIREIFPQANVFNALSASLAIGVMIIPLIVSLSEDAMIAVPQSLREAAYGLGANKFEVATQVVVPAARSGIAASFILAISRALGETMVVALAAGATPKFTLNPLESIQTMTAYIVQVSLGDTPFGTIEYKTIFAVATILFFITLIINLIGQLIVGRQIHEIT